MTSQPIEETQRHVGQDGLVFELARREHERHSRLIDLVMGATNWSARGDGIARLHADMRGHSRSEQTALISVLLVDAAARPLARRALAAHRELNRMLFDMHGTAHDAGALAAALLSYRARFRAYVRFEEDELYPTALVALGTDRCKRLSGRYEVASMARVNDDHMLAR